MILGVSAESNSSRERTDSSESTFNIVPTSQVAVVNETASFQCQSSDPDVVISWQMNETIILPSSPPLGISFEEAHSNGTIDVLVVTALPIYNGSMIKCIAFPTDVPTMPVFSRPAILQGNDVYIHAILQDIILFNSYSC